MSALRMAVPGMGWVPRVLCTGAYWRTVGRFLLWGPLIGGAPYIVFVFTIPFAYWFGAGPALVAGLLFAAWWHEPSRRWPAWGWRVAIGALCGLAAAALASFAMPWGAGVHLPDWSFGLVVALHGVPAAAILALLQKPPTSP